MPNSNHAKPAHPSSALQSSIRKYLASASLVDRQILYKRYAERKTLDEIASEIGIGKGAVETALIRAKANISTPRS